MLRIFLLSIFVTFYMQMLSK